MTERRRVVADRFRRIWHIVEHIAANPGHSRRELAEFFHLSERQLQADLNIIRTDMRLPLVRDGGYRFVAEGGAGASGGLTLEDALTLATSLIGATGQRSEADRERVAGLTRKLPVVFPPHLQPVVRCMLDAVRARHSGTGRLFLALAAALLHRATIRLHYPPGDISCPVIDPIVKPELLLPYLDGWYLVAHVRERGRSMVLRIDAVTAVTLAPGTDDAG